MIKKGCFLVIILALAFGVLFFSVEQTSVDAQAGLATSSARFVVADEASVSAYPKTDYPLPYPGILPDNPLYKLKMVRDRLWIFLTPDPIDRSELFLLYADKRLGAGKALIEGGQVSLGLSTLTKGEKYLERAVLEAEKAQKQGKKLNKLPDKLAKACLGHQEILTELRLGLAAEGKSEIDEQLKLVESLTQKLSLFKE